MKVFQFVCDHWHGPGARPGGAHDKPSYLPPASMATPDPGAAPGRRSVSMRDMVERFRTAPPRPREERAAEAETRVLWFKSGDAAPPDAAAGGEYRAAAAADLRALGASFDGGAFDAEAP